MTHHRFRAGALAAGISAALIALPAQAGLLGKLMDDGPKRVELNDATDKAAAYKEAFTPKGPFAKAPNAVSSSNKKVVIAGFQVEFATEQKAIQQGNGAAAGLASTTDVVYTLKGATDAQMQSVTDKLYTAFVAELKGRGYEVLPTSALESTGYKEALQKANQPPTHHERGAALDLLIGTHEKEVDNASVIATAKDTAPGVFSRFLGGLGPGAKAADSLQANVVHLRLKVNFARFEETGWFNPDLDSKPQNMISPSGTFMQVFMPGGQFTDYPMAHSIVLPNRLAEAANPVEASSGQTTQRAASGAVRVLGGFLKGGLGGLTDIAGGAVASAHSVLASGNYEVVAGNDYEDLVTKDAALAVAMLAEAFPKQ